MGVPVRDFTGVPVRDLPGVAVRGLTGASVRDLTGVPVRGLTGVPVRDFAWLSRVGPVISVLPLARTLFEDLTEDFFVTGKTGLETGFEIFFDTVGSRELTKPSFETTGLE